MSLASPEEGKQSPHSEQLLAEGPHSAPGVPLEPALARSGGAAANASSCQDWRGIMPDPSSELPVLSEGPVQPQSQRRLPWLGELGSSGAAGSGLGGFAGGEGRISEL